MHASRLPYRRYANFLHARDRLVGIVMFHLVLVIREVGIVEGHIIARDDHAVTRTSLRHHVMAVVHAHTRIQHLILDPTESSHIHSQLRVRFLLQWLGYLVCICVHLRLFHLFLDRGKLLLL